MSSKLAVTWIEGRKAIKMHSVFYPPRKHLRCSFCGKHVKPWKGSGGIDGWSWHKACWWRFICA